MTRLFAAVCAAMLLATSAAIAGTMGNGASQRAAQSQTARHNWIKASFDKGYSARTASGHSYTSGRFILDLDFASASTWAYDPASGTITQLPQVVENTNPTTGIGVVVKKNPGSSAARLTANSDGMTFDLPDAMDPGNYEIVITVPVHAINTKGAGSGNRTIASASWPATLTFHVVVQAARSEPQPEISSPRDPQSGLPAGKRMHKPFTMILDRSNPPTVVVGSGTSSQQ